MNAPQQASLPTRFALLAWLALGLLLAARIPAAIDRAQLGNDFGAYHAGAKAVLAGKDPGEARSARNADYLYPPAFAVVATPVASFPEHVGALLWLALNVLLIGVIAWQLWHLLPRTSARRRWVVPAGALVVGASLSHELLNGQVDLLVLVACLACVQALARNHPKRSGTALAAAVATKVTPLFLMLWLVMRRAWTAVAALAIALPLLMILIPAPFLGLGGSLEANKAWVGRVAAPYLSKSQATTDNDERPPEKRYGAGYSLRGVFLRSLTDEPVDFDGSTRGNWVAWPRGVAFALYVGLSVLLVLWVVHTMWRHRRRDVLGEASLFLAVTMVIAPLSHSANFLALWPAATWLLQVGGRAERVAVLVAACLLTLPEPLPTDIRAALLAGGVHVAAALVLAYFVRRRLMAAEAQAVAA